MKASTKLLEIINELFEKQKKGESTIGLHDKAREVLLEINPNLKT